ncbi:MAG: hypothetical protein A2172_04115 [Candidatus Woykebacteria bacterium RBG_13_40_15]|uniref:Translation elongation factor-like protein n=1 Tax=Candidatus Woykebacteria bacterium RBG_13_40_15 TaxID=1802593 RepID=A0A1G1W781_9BACT|nr:MAG: hypothetical protein A2172_04115 [Candidatus Woykebacteria bacterium RBG_13_40_15]
MAETKVGTIKHYYDHIGVGVLEVSKTVKVGDKIHLKGKVTDFTQEVSSMQSEHKDIDSAKAKEIVGLKTDQQVEEKDEVFKVG